MPWTWASTRGRAEPPQVVLPAADPATFLDRHGASHGPHLANVAAIAREVCSLIHIWLHPRHAYKANWARLQAQLLGCCGSGGRC